MVLLFVLALALKLLLSILGIDRLYPSRLGQRTVTPWATNSHSRSQQIRYNLTF